MKTPKKRLLPLLLCLPLWAFGCGGGNELGCGDGLLEPAEQCDDSNTADGDGCSALCALEAGTDCGPPPTLAPAAQLQTCDLSGADLSAADLTGANLNSANLIGANLTSANLTQANLQRAGLLLANLSGADLTEALLGEANLTGANLTGANLTQANLAEANLSNADLTDADLTNVSGQPFNADTAIYNNTTCPSGLNSDATLFTCIDQGFNR